MDAGVLSEFNQLVVGGKSEIIQAINNVEKEASTCGQYNAL